MDVEKIKKLAQQILSACGDSKEDDYEEEDSETPEMESEDGSEEDSEEKPSGAMSGKNLAVLIALKKKMGKK